MNRRVAIERHRAAHLRRRWYVALRPQVPRRRPLHSARAREQIAQNLAFVNWTLLTGLALGSFAAVVLLRRRTDATHGYLGFTTLCALGVRGPRLALRRGAAGGAAPARRSRRPGLGRPAPGGARAVRGGRAGLAVAPLPRPAGRAARARGGGRRGGRDACSVPSLGRRSRLGIGRARGPARGRPGGRHRRRLRGDDPGPLVPRHAEAPDGPAHPPRAASCWSSSSSRSSCSGLDRDRRRAGGRRRSRR